MQILKPFGPSIAKINIPDQIVSNMNKYVEEIIIDKKKSEELDFGKNLAGNVQQEFRLDLEFMKENNWAEFLGNSCVEWLSSGHNISVKKFEIISSWIVRQFKNEYNPIHYHGGDISGVGYLKVPKDMGKTIQKNKNIQHNGKLVLIDGSTKFLCKSTYVIDPKIGELYLFPSYMMHTVYPFSDTSKERRSVSFNAKIDDDSTRLR
jgi:hypothetical protein